MPWSGIDWSATSWEQVCARHRWSVPERLNIAALACDRHADGTGRLALVTEGPGGAASSSRASSP